ncbi:shieldin complex subunit 2 [Synchiropus picturatus]
MSHRGKAHVFWGAPPASSSVQSGSQEAGWLRLDLRRRRGRLQPSAAATTDVLPSDSLHEYLDSVASDAAPQHSPESKSGAVSVPTERLSVWTLSQSLLLQEEGVALQVTSHGLFCSQEPQPPALPPGTGPTTPLSRCQEPSIRYTVLVAVLHPCHLKEVKAKSGPSAGTLIPLASLLVTDQSAVEMTVVLWRRAAFWVVAVGPGDVVMISGLQVSQDRWRGERILQSTFSSKLLRLGQVTLTSCPPAPPQVPPHALEALCGFLRQQRPLLVSLPPRRPQDLSRLPYASLSALRPNTLVHARLRVTRCCTCTEWKPEAESRSRSALQQLAVVMVEQSGGQDGRLLLWGGATSWLQSFRTNKDTVWDIRFLLVREGSTSGCAELHSTPWSSARALDPSDPRGRRCLPSSGPSPEMDLRTLLSQKFTGEAMLQVQVGWFQFRQSSPQPVLTASSGLAGIVAALRGDVTYTGCAGCRSELDTDANGIFRACYPCLPRTSVGTFYRAALMGLGGPEQSQLCVQVPPVALQKILVAAPQKVRRESGSDEESIRMAAEKIWNLLELPKKTFVVTLRSIFMCDENDVAIAQEFTLLDMQPVESTSFT